MAIKGLKVLPLQDLRSCLWPGHCVQLAGEDKGTEGRSSAWKSWSRNGNWHTLARTQSGGGQGGWGGSPAEEVGLGGEQTLWHRMNVRFLV